MRKKVFATPQEREKYWTSVIEAARRDPLGVTHYCNVNKIPHNTYYVWFRRLRPKHPEWENLVPPNGRSKAAARRTTSEPETKVSSKQARRRFSREYKAQILKETDNASAGQVSAILRREGLYASHLQNWRAERAAGTLEPRKRGRKPNPLTTENKKLRAENERLLKRIRQQEMLIDLQKKVSEILNVKLPTLDDTE